MATQELAPAPNSAGPTTHEADPALAEQMVLSGAGLVNRGIDLGRLNATAVVNVVDEIVLGTLDVVEEWTKLTGQLGEQLATKPVEVARRAYVTGSANVRQLVATL